MIETYLIQSYNGKSGLIAWSFQSGVFGITTIRQTEKRRRLNLYFGPYQKESEEL